MKILCLVKRWGHHTASGGYDRLAAAVGAETIARPTGLRDSPLGKAWNAYFATDHPFLFDYQLGDFLGELRALARTATRPPDIVHVLYGDEQLNLLLRYRAMMRCPLVVTFHVPYARSVERFEKLQKHLMGGIDAAIVMCESEVEPFERAIGKGKVVAIPHGVDIEAFAPSAPHIEGERLRIVAVGEHMRDWTALHRVIDEANRRDLGIDFTVITLERWFAHLTGCDNTTLLSKVPEARLLHENRVADAAFIPVLDATANNAALEALACGTPVISTAIGGLPDYVGPEAGWLFPKGEIAPVLDLLTRAKADRSIFSERREAARARALTMDWRVVGDQTKAVYAGLTRGIAPAEALRAFKAG